MEIAVKDFKIAIISMLRDLKGNMNIMRRDFMKDSMELLVLRNT